MIKYYFKNFELGTLSFDKSSNEFVYNSNIENEQEVKKSGEMFFYNLYNSVDKRQKNLFDEFLEISMSLTRKDIVNKAKINEKDSLFEKLEKLSKLRLNDDGFYIAYCEN